MTRPAPAPVVPFPHPQIPDDAYRRMALVLRVGLLTSVAILLGALIAYLVENPGASSSSAISSNPIVTYLSLGGLGHGLATGARRCTSPSGSSSSSPPPCSASRPGSTTSTGVTRGR